MDALINIQILNWVYPLMYLAAFLVGVCYIFMQAVRNRWPLDTVLLMLGCTVTAAVIGSKIVMIPSGMFWATIDTWELPEVAGKSFLGGVAGGVAGMLIAIRILRMPLVIADTVAFVLPASLLLGRVGCLFAGCCFGTPTGASWGITYPAGSHAHTAHLQAGWIDPENIASLAVHPVPLYEMLFCITIIVLILMLRKHLTRPGNQMFAILALYSILRFGGEFFRHSSQENILSTAQIATAFAAILFLSIIIYRESKEGTNTSVVQVQIESRIALILTLWVFVIIPGNWFSPVESILLQWTLFGLTVYLILDFIAHKYFENRIRQTVLVSAIPVLLMVSMPYEAESDSTSNNYFKYGLSFFTGNFGAWDIDEGPVSYMNDDCGTYATYPNWDGVERDYNYKGGGITIENVDRRASDQKRTIGLRASFGQLTAPPVTTERRNLNRYKDPIVMFNPFIRWDYRNIGFAFGVQTGTAPARSLEARQEARGNLELQSIKLTPMAALRFFPLNSLFMELRYQDADPGSFPLMRTQAGLGAGFTINDQPGSFRAGFTDWGIYLEPDVPISDYVSLNGSLGFGMDSFLRSIQYDHNHFMLGLKYKP
jgi:prolipoprotein diacylglyceryltransferase